MSERLNPNEIFEKITTNTQMTPEEREKFAKDALRERKQLDEQLPEDTEGLN